MAWPSQKSALRRRLNIRWMRWAFWRSVFRCVPLARSFSFPLESVAAISVADRLIEHARFARSARFGNRELRHIERAAANDKLTDAGHPLSPPAFRRQIATVPNCAVLGHVGAVIKAETGALLAQSASGVPNWNCARPGRLRRRRPLDDGLATFLEGTKHYFHFFASLLPLLAYLDRRNPAGEKLTVLVAADGPHFQHQVCDAVANAYPAVRFETVSPDERIEIRRYLWLYDGCGNAEWLPVDASAGARLADLMRAHYDLAGPRAGRLIFFSRGNAKQRRLLNEDELEAIAAGYGFERFEAHCGNHDEQVRCFGEADVIVAVHGAGLTNLLFARPGATVIEIFPKNCIKSTYLWLARQMGLNYRALIGGPGDYRQTFQLSPDDFAVAIDETLQSLSDAASPPPVLPLQGPVEERPLQLPG
jgi:capsular polysaccharide biosynthesis protein